MVRYKIICARSPIWQSIRKLLTSSGQTHNRRESGTLPPSLHQLNDDEIAFRDTVRRFSNDVAKPSDGLLFTLASPDEVKFNKKIVKQVDIPSKASYVGVLDKHVPTIGILITGILRVTDLQGKIETFEISGGTFAMNMDGSLQVLPDIVGGLNKREGTMLIQKWEGGKPVKV